MSFSRISFPENFYDRTSTQLLAAPDPQYFYAQLFMSALMLSLPTGGDLGLPMPDRQVGGAGGDYSPAERDRLMLSDPLSGEIFAAKFDFNAESGSTIRVNRPAWENSTYTVASRQIASGSTISVVPITPKSEQNDLTLFRFGGPYDQANSRVAPYAIERFDANMGVHAAQKIVGTHMARDFHRFIDAVHVALLNAGTAIYPAGMTAVADATADGEFPFTYELLSRVEAEADSANLPALPDGHRMFVGTPKQINALRHDRAYQRASEKHERYNILFPSYVGSVNKTHIFKSTTLSTTAAGASVDIHTGHYIAPGALMGGMGRPPRVAPSTDDNYGETVKVVWIADLAFRLANDSFVYAVKTTSG